MTQKIRIKIISQVIPPGGGINCMEVLINNGKLYDYKVNLTVAENVEWLISQQKYGKALDLLKKFKLS